MGNWQMEVGRMTMYILFPIGIYYCVNRAESVEKWIENEKKKLEPISKEKHVELLNFIEECNKKRQLKHIAEMEAQYLED